MCNNSLFFQLPILHFFESFAKTNYILPLLMYPPTAITLQLLLCIIFKLLLNFKADYINSAAQYKMKIQSPLLKKLKKKKVPLKLLKCKTFFLYSCQPSSNLLWCFFICNLILQNADFPKFQRASPCDSVSLAHSHRLLDSSSPHSLKCCTPAGVEKSVPLSHELTVQPTADGQSPRNCNLCTKTLWLPGFGIGQKLAPNKLPIKHTVVLQAPGRDGHSCTQLRDALRYAAKLGSP